MELIDLLFFPSVVMAGIVLWAFATYDKKVAAEQIYASSLTAKQWSDRLPKSDDDKCDIGCGDSSE